MGEILNRVNWVDLVALILLIRISYISSYIGVGKQILPIILLTSILSITLYNYREIASFFIKKYSFDTSLCIFLSFIIMVLVFSMVYRTILRITGVLFPLGPMEAGGIEKVGGVVLGLLRTTIIVGLLIIALALVPVKFVEESVKNSYSGTFFIKRNAELYSYITNAILRKEKISPENTVAQVLANKKNYLFKPIDVRKKARFFRKEEF